MAGRGGGASGSLFGTGTPQYDPQAVGPVQHQSSRLDGDQTLRQRVTAQAGQGSDRIPQTTTHGSP